MLYGIVLGSRSLSFFLHPSTSKNNFHLQLYLSLNDVKKTKMFTTAMKNILPMGLGVVDWDNSIKALFEDSWSLRLSMEPSAQHLDIIDVVNGRILQIPMARPAGPWGPRKKCLKNGKCSCLAGYTGDLCDGDQCPHDPNKRLPGICGCGQPDLNSTGWPITDPMDC